MSDKENKIRYSERFFTKKFSDEVSKKAYLKACKWIAKYVLSNDDLKDVEFGIEKTGPLEFKVSLYATLSEEELRERHCQICRDTHSSFFISEETNCNWCKLGAYHRRADELIAVKKEHYKNRLRESMGVELNV